MRASGWLAAAVLLLSAAPTRGHEGGVDVRGVVVTADAAHLAVRGADGKEQRFALTPGTRIVVEGRNAKPADLKPGQRAVVHGRRAAAGLEAMSVRAAASTSQRPASSK